MTVEKLEAMALRELDSLGGHIPNLSPGDSERLPELRGLEEKG